MWLLKNLSLRRRNKMKTEQWVREKLVFFRKRLDNTTDITTRFLLMDRISLLKTILEEA